MMPAAFKYKRPMSLEEATRHPAEHGYEARVLGGGAKSYPGRQGCHGIGRNVDIDKGTGEVKVYRFVAIDDRNTIWATGSNLIQRLI